MRTEGRGPRRAGGGRTALVWLAAGVIVAAGLTGLAAEADPGSRQRPRLPRCLPGPGGGRSRARSRNPIVATRTGVRQ